MELTVPAVPIQQARAWVEGRDLAWMKEVISTNVCWVAATEDEVAGWVAVEGQRVIGLFVDPSYARRGIGSRLLVFAERHLSSAGIPSIELEASWNSEEFYLRRGYQPLADRPVAGPRPMRKVLNSST